MTPYRPVHRSRAGRQHGMLGPARQRHMRPKRPRLQRHVQTLQRLAEAPMKLEQCRRNVVARLQHCHAVGPDRCAVQQQVEPGRRQVKRADERRDAFALDLTEKMQREVQALGRRRPGARGPSACRLLAHDAGTHRRLRPQADEESRAGHLGPGLGSGLVFFSSDPDCSFSRSRSRRCGGPVRSPTFGYASIRRHPTSLSALHAPERTPRTGTRLVEQCHQRCHPALPGPIRRPPNLASPSS
jgi:hypothetical protein